MTARFVYWINTSLDGRIARDETDAGEDWARIDPSLHRVFNDRARAMSMSVEGRIVHEMMEDFWPAARDDHSLDPVLREYGRIWTDTPKILVSRTRTTAQHNTEIYGTDALERLERLRAESHGDIGVGGASVATQLLNAHLLDELMLFVHPVVLGSGRELFDELAEPLQLDLIEAAEYGDGVGLRRYAVRGAR